MVCGVESRGMRNVDGRILDRGKIEILGENPVKMFLW
jgi:hypothetical protein